MLIDIANLLTHTTSYVNRYMAGTRELQSKRSVDVEPEFGIVVVLNQDADAFVALRIHLCQASAAVYCGSFGTFVTSHIRKTWCKPYELVCTLSSILLYV